MVDHEGGSDVMDWRCGPKVRPVRRGWLIHVGARNRPSGSVREPAPKSKITTSYRCSSMNRLCKSLAYE
ncbi:BQ5605_C020g09058 [Microbotryum silenes-dioicae]|uniref:BQ5605_C020g09058 protein n=1 Tax=Microbotryum silenes-dioicae TaxID=796604 RepID=A0A2X0MM27_9BASI|nr:BQ5605_C020g09058 [Microbotryum silenes-dioicae]